MRVFLTIDTEVYPYCPDWRATQLRDDFRRDILGATASGEFGLAYQLERLERHGLKATFFVEALFASAVGIEPLRRIVDMVQGAGHEVQLHVHPEWLQWMDEPLVPPREGEHIRLFTADEQRLLLEQALTNLRAAGARDVCAYRAGNYGASFETLRALAQLGIRYDTSYNEMYLGDSCGLGGGAPIVQPRMLEGVVEMPVACFRQVGGATRHAQLCAVSAGELRRALRAALAGGWQAFVIVSHSFELVRGRSHRGAGVAPDLVMARRFDELCAFLARHRDVMPTSGFAGLEPADVIGADGVAPLRMPAPLTAVRMIEQLVRRATERLLPQPVAYAGPSL